MPKTTSASAAAATKSPTASDSDEYEYEYEYEEIEVEEEVEVEEEISDEEVNEEEEEEEDEEEEEEEEEVEEKGEDIPPPIDDEDHEKGKTTTADDGDMLYNDKSSPQPDVGGITSVNTSSNPEGVSGKEVKVIEGGLNEDNHPPSEKEIKGTNEDNCPPSEIETKKIINEDNFPPSEKETKGTNDQDINDKHQKQEGVSVRLDVPLRRPRSLSPGKETKEGNKRQVLVCEFFAKGWCIKGNSCRFLHIKEPKDKNQLQDKSQNTTSISAQMTKIPPPNHNSVWTSTSMLFSSSSWNPDSFPTLKEVHDSRSASETKQRLYGDLNDSSARFTRYNWEPSKPFRSMFLLSQGLSPCSLYDPIRDSMDQQLDFGIGVGVSKFSSSCQGPSTSSTHSPKNINPPVKKKTPDIDNNGSERHSVASTHDNRDMSSNAEKGNKHVYNGDMMEASDRSMKKEVKVVTDENHHKVDIESKGDEVMQKESKALKNFRGALIEFVKEIVKPAWREGNLSKDAHKLIVKKAVDKVISTLPAENVPSTEDAVDFYLSSCQPKLVKLVEGYISKYGKC